MVCLLGCYCLVYVDCGGWCVCWELDFGVGVVVVDDD